MFDTCVYSITYFIFVSIDSKMFSGFQNQMSSIGSWIGSKKAPGQSQETSPQNPEILEEKVVPDVVATNPGIRLYYNILLQTFFKIVFILKN